MLYAIHFLFHIAKSSAYVMCELKYRYSRGENDLNPALPGTARDQKALVNSKSRELSSNKPRGSDAA